MLTTVRSEEKGEAVKNAYRDVSQNNLDTVVIPDVAAEGAFEGLGSHGLEAVIHLASPVSLPPKSLASSFSKNRFFKTSYSFTTMSPTRKRT